MIRCLPGIVGSVGCKNWGQRWLQKAWEHPQQFLRCSRFSVRTQRLGSRDQVGGVMRPLCASSQDPSLLCSPLFPPQVCSFPGLPAVLTGSAEVLACFPWFALTWVAVAPQHIISFTRLGQKPQVFSCLYPGYQINYFPYTVITNILSWTIKLY